MKIPASVCVYCGSAAEVAQSHRDAAAAVGRLLGRQGIRLIYGGGRIGLMGLAADAALAAGGKVTGIIPRHIVDMEVAHTKLTELVVVETMHERKRLMVERAEGFVVLPGGLGTMDETFEILTWKQLSLHRRPIVILNVDGYWNPFLELIRRMVDSGFLAPAHAALFRTVGSVDEILPALAGDNQDQTGISDLI